jgi:hypothetical protein
MLLFAHDREAALGEHTDAGDVVLGDSGVQRALGDLGDEIGERSSRVSAAPVLATDPISDAALAIGDPAAMFPTTCPSSTIVRAITESSARIFAQCAS